MDFERAIAAIEREFPKALKTAFQRSGFALAAYVERYVDENGPTRYPSTSDRWGLQTGRASRSLIPGQTENVFRVKDDASRPSFEFGSSVFYYRFLELGTSRMRARPSLRPGFDDFRRELWPSILRDAVRQTLNAAR